MLITTDSPIQYRIFETPSALAVGKVMAVALVVIAILGASTACLAFASIEEAAVCLAIGGMGLALAAAASASDPFYSDPFYQPSVVSIPVHYRSVSHMPPFQPFWHQRPFVVHRDRSYSKSPGILWRSSRGYFTEGNRVKVGNGHVYRNDWMASPFGSTGPIQRNRVQVGSRRR